MIPGPTTAGDFCRRFAPQDIERLQRAINQDRLSVWAQQGPAFVEKTARVDTDGSFVTAASECKEGIALSYKGTWGYHSLVVSPCSAVKAASRSSGWSLLARTLSLGSRGSYGGVGRRAIRLSIPHPRTGDVDTFEVTG